MKTKNHTPGPWRHVYGAIMANGEMICEIPNPHWPNARIIASAPDMFDALQAIVDAFGDQDSLLIDQCKAALSKAKGESK